MKRKAMSLFIGLLVWCVLCWGYYVMLLQWKQWVDTGLWSTSQKEVYVETGNLVATGKSEAVVNMANTFDMETDDSITKYVGKGHPFHEKAYIPSDLVSLKNTKYLAVYTKWRIPNQELRKEAKEYLEKMAKDFFDTFKQPLYVYSAYRSYEYQKNSIGKACKDEGFCAVEWESEHQWGLTLDFWETTNEEQFLRKYQKYYDWLKENAHKYGFHQSYQNGIEKDWYYIEPWHWRYLWEALATLLHEKNQTFVNYYRDESERVEK